MRIIKQIERRLHCLVNIPDEDFMFLMGLYETLFLKGRHSTNNNEILHDWADTVRHRVVHAKGRVDRFYFLR
jgi:hypothetical protein